MNKLVFIFSVGMLSLASVPSGFSAEAVLAADRGQILADASQQEDVGNYEEAARLYMTLAEEGDAEAQFRLGELYRLGDLVPENWPGDPLKWLRKSAISGYVPAQTSYGLLLSHFESNKNLKKVRKHLVAAADAGDTNAQLYAGLFFLGDLNKPESTKFKSIERALKYLQLAATNGVMEAQRVLASMYFEGVEIGVDTAEGARWTHALAERGDRVAQARMGELYSQGVGVDQDWALAHDWYHRAAAQGDADSMRQLATIYARGLGVEPDPGEAEAWNQRAKRIPSNPELVSYPGRVFPKRRYRAGEGWVTLDFTVTQEGTVTNARVIHADPPVVYNDLSIEAAKQFTYRPAMIEGQPVSTENVRYCMTWILWTKTHSRTSRGPREAQRFVRVTGGVDSAQISYDRVRVRGLSPAMDQELDLDSLRGLCLAENPSAEGMAESPNQGG